MRRVFSGDLAAPFGSVDVVVVDVTQRGTVESPGLLVSSASCRHDHPCNSSIGLVYTRIHLDMETS